MKIIIANSILFVGSLMIVLTGLIKDKKKLLIAQIPMYIVLSTGLFLLGGYTGVTTNCLNLLRNIYCLLFSYGYIPQIVFSVLLLIAAAIFNTFGFVGYFPAIAAISYTIVVGVKDVKLIKLIVMLSQILWVIYDICIKAYSSIPFDSFSVITNLIALIQLIIKDKKEKAG